jgi:hypothetical protein
VDEADVQDNRKLQGRFTIVMLGLLRETEIRASASTSFSVPKTWMAGTKAKTRFASTRP